jgi:hypothetical protein
MPPCHGGDRRFESGRARQIAFQEAHATRARHEYKNHPMRVVLSSEGAVKL